MSFNKKVEAEKVVSTTNEQPTLFVDKVPELASISSISAATTTNGNSDTTTTPMQCNEKWKEMSLAIRAEKLKMQKRIAIYVNDHLFKRLKFFNLEVMLFDTRKNSICQRICDSMHIAESAKKAFWSTYSPCVETAIRCGRNDAVQAIKNSFLKGKPIFASIQQL